MNNNFELDDIYDLRDCSKELLHYPIIDNKDKYQTIIAKYNKHSKKNINSFKELPVSIVQKIFIESNLELKRFYEWKNIKGDK